MRHVLVSVITALAFFTSCTAVSAQQSVSPPPPRVPMYLIHEESNRKIMYFEHDGIRCYIIDGYSVNSSRGISCVRK